MRECSGGRVLAQEARDELVDLQGTELSRVTGTDPHRVAFGLFWPHNQQIRVPEGAG
jgi:hypothetical protein